MIAGVYDLGSRSITAALTGEIITTGYEAGLPVEFLGNLSGIVSLSILGKLVYGSGGLTIAAVVQTSLNQGQDWIDIARFDFTTANALKFATVGIFAPAAPAAIAALGSEGKLDNCLGDRLRAAVTSTGTYASTTLALTAVVRESG